MPTAKLYLDPTIAAFAGPYYTLFPVEPTPSGSAADWIQTDAKHVRLSAQTLSELLKSLASTATQGGNVLIVCHGTNRGLHFHVGDTSQEVFLETEPLTAIQQNLEGKVTDDNTEKILKLKPGFYKNLKALILKVQSLALNRIDVRACDTGKNSIAMSQLQVFFNCNTFCAPKLLDSFGEINYGRNGTDPNVWKTWLRDHRNHKYWGTPPDRFALSLDFSRTVKLDALAESTKAITDWVASHLPPSTVFTSGSQLRYHGLTNLKSMVFAGEAEFRAQLVEADRGKEPWRATGQLPRPGQAP